MQSKLDKKKKKLLTSTYLTLCTLKGHRALGTVPSSINTLRPPRFQKKKKMNFRHFGAFSRQFLSFYLNPTQNTHKNLSFLISPINLEVMFLLSSSSLWSLYLGFEVQECRCSFLATIYAHFIFCSCFLLSFIFLVCLLLYLVSQHVLLLSQYVYLLS